MERWRARAIWVVTRADADYPRRLKGRLRGNSPPVLYGCGDPAFLDGGGLAVGPCRELRPWAWRYLGGRYRAAGQASFRAGPCPRQRSAVRRTWWIAQARCPVRGGIVCRSRPSRTGATMCGPGSRCANTATAAWPSSTDATSSGDAIRTGGCRTGPRQRRERVPPPLSACLGERRNRRTDTSCALRTRHFICSRHGPLTAPGGWLRFSLTPRSAKKRGSPYNLERAP